MTAPADIESPERVAAELEPILRRHAPWSEANRRPAPEVIDALHASGVLRAWIPRAYGGLEMEPLPALRLVEELARIDGSVGWIAGNGSALAVICQSVPDELAEEMFTAPRALMAGAAGPPGVALPVESGYRLSGRWPFASGCHYGSWLHGTALIMDGDAARLGPDGYPQILLSFFAPSEAEILDTWQTLGMRGTGSHDIEVQDLFVPEQHTVLMGPFDQPGRAYTGPLYRLGLWIAPAIMAAVAIGIGRAALDDLVDLAAGKTPNHTQTLLADKSSVQAGVARARALIDAARSYLHATVADAWAFVQGGRRITVEEGGVPLALAGTFGVDASLRAAQLVKAAAGTSGFRTEHRFQQYFRDIDTVSQHAFSSASRFESLGQILLGRQSDWPFYYV